MASCKIQESKRKARRSINCVLGARSTEESSGRYLDTSQHCNHPRSDVLKRGM